MIPDRALARPLPAEKADFGIESRQRRVAAFTVTPQACYPSSLVANEIEPDGTLRLMFQSGDRISVPPDPHHEPWQINGPGDALVVCTSGVPAKLATWS